MSEVKAEITPIAVVPAEDAAPDTYVTEEVTLRVRNMLGIKKESWDRFMPKPGEAVPRFALRKITARLCLNMGSESLAKMAHLSEVCEGLLNDPDVDPAVKTSASRTIILATEAMGKLFPAVMKLADDGGDRTAEDDRANGAKARSSVLPPQLNLQVNIAGQTVATAGNCAKQIPLSKK